MDISKKLVKKIKSIDNLLVATKEKRFSESIDINQDDWVEKVQQQSIAFRNEHSVQIELISDDLLKNFDKLSKFERKNIIDTLDQTKYLQSFLITPFDKKGFRSSVLILILQNLGKDSRDSFLELNELIKKAEDSRIDYRKIISELIPLADNTNKHGLGSMSEFLEKISKTR